LIVGDDDLGVLREQIIRLRDHPGTRFGSIGARDHSPDIVVVDPYRATALLAAHSHR
jgi:hypothetical protein